MTVSPSLRWTVEPGMGGVGVEAVECMSSILGEDGVPIGGEVELCGAPIWVEEMVDDIKLGSLHTVVGGATSVISGSWILPPHFDPSGLTSMKIYQNKRLVTIWFECKQKAGLDIVPGDHASCWPSSNYELWSHPQRASHQYPSSPLLPRSITWSLHLHHHLLWHNWINWDIWDVNVTKPVWGLEGTGSAISTAWAGMQAARSQPQVSHS